VDPETQNLCRVDGRAASNANDGVNVRSPKNLLRSLVQLSDRGMLPDPREGGCMVLYEYLQQRRRKDISHYNIPFSKLSTFFISVVLVAREFPVTMKAFDLGDGKREIRWVSTEPGP
jgi:hypothetical protein